MAQHEPGIGAEALRKGHRAFNDRDRDALLDLFAEDVTWHVDGNGPGAGTHRGRDAVWENFFQFLWEAPARVEDHDILDNAEHTVAIGEFVFDLEDEQKTWKFVEVTHMNETGKLKERWALVERQDELDQFARQMTEQQAG